MVTDQDVESIDLPSPAGMPDPVFEGEGVVMALPHATSSALDIRCTVDSADERLAELVRGGRYLVTLTPIEG